MKLASLKHTFNFVIISWDYYLDDTSDSVLSKSFLVVETELQSLYSFFGLSCMVEYFSLAATEGPDIISIPNLKEMT